MAKDKKNKKREKKSLSVSLSKLTDTLNGELFSDTDLGVNDEEDSAFWVSVPNPHAPMIGDQFEVIGSRGNSILLAPIEVSPDAFKPGDTVEHPDFGESTLIGEEDSTVGDDEALIVDHENHFLHVVELKDLTLSIDVAELEHERR